MPRAFLKQQNITDVRFTFSAQQRPHCALSPNTRLVMDYNVSHDGDWVAAAFALVPAGAMQPRIGIDVMRIQMPWVGPVEELYESMQSLMSVQEQQRYAETPQDKKLFYLIRLWTHKEAFSKATGEGLRLNLGDYDVCLSATSSDMTTIRKNGRVLEWSFREFPLEGDATLCVASEGFDVPDWHKCMVYPEALVEENSRSQQSQ